MLVEFYACRYTANNLFELFVEEMFLSAMVYYFFYKQSETNEPATVVKIRLLASG